LRALAVVKKEKAITAEGKSWVRRLAKGYEANLDFYQAAARDVNNCRLSLSSSRSRAYYACVRSKMETTLITDQKCPINVRRR